MDGTGTEWLLGAPQIILGLLGVGFGWRAAVRHRQAAPAAGGLARWWSSALLLPACGALLVATGLLFGLGFGVVALWLLYAVAGVAVVASAVGAVGALRAGERRTAAWRAGLSVFLLVSFALIVLGWDTATDVLLAVAGGGLLLVSVVGAVRRWRTADASGRRMLLQSVALAVGLSCQAASSLLPAHLRPLGLVLTVIGLVSLVVALGLILASRRARSSPPTPEHPTAP